MTNLINNTSLLLDIILMLIYFLIFPAFLVWMIMAFLNKNHPKYKTDESGQQYCPAIQDLQQIKRNRIEMKQQQRRIRILGITPPTESINPHSSGMSVADEIAKLAELKTQGHLTEQEFIEKKQKLLS